MGQKSQNAYPCDLCGCTTHPYKIDPVDGNIVVACDNTTCLNSEGFDGSTSIQLSKLLREQQLHSRQFVDYLGGYKGKFYNAARKVYYSDGKTWYV